MRPSRFDQINPRRPNLAAAVVMAALAGVPPAAVAGGGPPNLLLVVNALSDGSKRVANEYVRLRDLPASNVVYVDYQGPRESASSDVFRKQILAPVFAAIARRGLAEQIDVVAYSTDFPWRIGIEKDFPKPQRKPQDERPFASLTGATYLSGFMIRKHPGLLSLDSNWYVPRADPQTSRLANLSRCMQTGASPSRGFRARVAWGPGGQAAQAGGPGRRYLMATMLGVTTGRGNSVEEVIASLRRATEADVEPPRGKVYFMQNGDIRSKTRHQCYRGVAERLRKANQPAEVRGGVLPPSGEPIAGVVTGANTFDVPGARLNIRPGAICEHLTSNGGMLLDKPWATPLSEWIRAGATGTCGTVVEPFARQAKFPLPTVQLHYRRGCSMAESFYQSVAGPYQLLVVGDPLCQPWARRPTLVVDGAATLSSAADLAAYSLALLKGADPPPVSEAEAEPQGPTLRLTPVVTASADETPGNWELYVDGRRQQEGVSGASAEIDRTKLAPGWHELRVVGVAPDPIAAQRAWRGSCLGRSEADSGDEEGARAPTLRVAESQASFGGRVSVAVAAPAAERIRVLQNRRVVAVVTGESGTASIEAARLGRGPVRLQAEAEPSMATSPPVWLTVR